MTAHQALQEIVESRINLTPTQREQASRSHNHIRELLLAHSRLNNRFPWLVEGDFLSGSFARKTKIRPLDDIDVMMVLDGHGLNVIRNGRYTAELIRGGGRMGSPIHQHVNAPGLISSVQVLDSFHRALSEAYRKSEVRRDGQVVNVYLDSYGLGLDIVPAFHLTDPSGRETYFIPEGHSRESWIDTNPKEDQRISDDLHRKHGGHLRPVVKLLKQWNQNRTSGQLRSYHLEATAWHIFDARSPMIQNYPEALHYFFERAAPYIWNCPDPTGVGTSVDRYLTDAQRLDAEANRSLAFEVARTAVGLERLGQHEEASRRWVRLIG